MLNIICCHFFAIMKGEVDAAVKFLIKLIKQNSSLSEEILLRFEACLRLFLIQKFCNHWHPEKPWQGQGYRCLRVNGTNRKDPTIAKAALECGLQYSDLKLPLELTLWVDPKEVCCRFGEHKGSYCTIASFKEAEKEKCLEGRELLTLSNSVTQTPSEKPLKERIKVESNSKNSFSVSKSPLSHKENISPLRERPLSDHNQNSFESKEKKFRASCDALGFVSRINGKGFNVEPPMSIFPPKSNGLPLFSHNENISPYYKHSWMSYPTSISPPHHTFASSGFYDYSPYLQPSYLRKLV